MVKNLLLVSITLGCLSSCTKTNSSSPNNKKDSTQVSLISSVTYYDNVNQYNVRKDSLSYDPKGNLVNWINYNYLYLVTVPETANYSFTLNSAYQISSYTLVSTIPPVTPSQISYNIGYDNLNRIVSKTASSGISVSAYNQIYQYDQNNIIFNQIGVSTQADTLQITNNNISFRAHTGIGEVENLQTKQYLHYSTYRNPFYDSSLVGAGALFFTCFVAEPGRPEADFLGDLISKNLVDSFYFVSRFYYPTTWGSYKYTWTADSLGKVIQGNLIISDSTRDETGYESTQYMNYTIEFNYKSWWIYN